jgi:lysine/ornithine N-monooxygenase
VGLIKSFKLGGTFAINGSAIDKIKNGEIDVKPSVDEATGKIVRFSNGDENEFDVVIEATGYERKFPFLDKSIFSMSTHDSWGLYR